MLVRDVFANLKFGSAGLNPESSGYSDSCRECDEEVVMGGMGGMGGGGMGGMGGGGMGGMGGM